MSNENHVTRYKKGEHVNCPRFNYRLFNVLSDNLEISFNSPIQSSIAISIYCKRCQRPHNIYIR